MGCTVLTPNGFHAPSIAAVGHHIVNDFTDIFFKGFHPAVS